MSEKNNWKNLQQGDIILLNLNPTKGHEQRGERPCIVLTKDNHLLGGLVGIAPITTNNKVFPLHIPLSEGMKTSGKVLLDQHKMLDVESRGYQYFETAPENLVAKCVAILKLLYGMK